MLRSIRLFGAIAVSLPLVAALGPAAPRSSRDGVGAAYFINNEPSNNVVIVHEILSDGTVKFSKGVSTGGKGAHGIAAPVPTPPGTDQLFSQNSVLVANDNLFAINAGSNTLSMFAIDPNEPTNIRKVGPSVDTKGEFPISVAVSPKTNDVCVLNAGKINGVTCFTQDPIRGLRPLPNTTRMIGINATTPPSGPFDSVTMILFSEDGEDLIASVKGDFTVAPGFLAKWKVGPDGSLSTNWTKSVNNTSGLPFSLTPIKGTKAYLNTDPGPENSFTIFDYTHSDVANSTGYVVNGSVTMCWSAYNPVTDKYFIVDSGAATIRELSIDKSIDRWLEPTILQITQFKNGSGTIDTDVAVIKNKAYLYTLASAFTSVDVMDVTSSGQGKIIQTYNFSAPATAQHVTPAIAAQGMATYIKRQFRQH